MGRKALDPANCTLLELVHAQTGSMLRSAQIVAFILAWAQTRDRLGRTPTIEEYAADWKQSRRTAFREQERFRSAFPKLETPGPIVDRMRGRDQRLDATGIAA